MGEIGKIVAGFEHGRVHERRQSCILSGQEALLGDGNRFLLFAHSQHSYGRVYAVGTRAHTSPFSSLKTSLALPPSTVLLTSSEATHPSAASGCHALVPTS